MADETHPTTFASVDDAVRYWKGMYDEVECEYNEYKETSAEYEHELEIEMKQLEDKLKDKERTRQQELMEADKLKATHDKLVRDSCNIQDRLQAQLTTSENECQKLKLRIRKLEQEGDEIEQTARRAQADIEGLNGQTEDTLEQIAYVEQENAMLVVELQHVKEQMKELQIELEVFNIRHKRKESEQAEQLEIARAHKSMLQGTHTPTLAELAELSPDAYTDTQGHTHTQHTTVTHTNTHNSAHMQVDSPCAPDSAGSVINGVDAMAIESAEHTHDSDMHTPSHTTPHTHTTQTDTDQATPATENIETTRKPGATSTPSQRSNSTSTPNEAEPTGCATDGSQPTDSATDESEHSKAPSPSKLQSLADRVGKVFAPAGTALSMVNDILDRVAMIEKSLSEAQKGRRGSTTRKMEVAQTEAK